MARLLEFVLVSSIALAEGCSSHPTGSLPPGSAALSPGASAASEPSAGGRPSGETSAPGPERIVVLAGTVGAMALVGVGSAARTGLVPVQTAGLPPSAAWLAGDGSILLVTTLTGTVLEDAGSGGATWASLGGDLGQLHPSRAFAALSPAAAAGDRDIVVVDGDPGSGGPGRLVLETLTGRVLRRFTLTSVIESAPAWLPGGRIGVVIRDGRDVPRAIALDPASGAMVWLSGMPVRSIGIGGGVAAMIGVDGSVRAGAVASWLAGGVVAALPAGGGPVALQVQPSPSGTELAVVDADASGDAGSIRILAVGDGWHEIARFALPRRANRAVVSWLAAR